MNYNMNDLDYQVKDNNSRSNSSKDIDQVDNTNDLDCQVKDDDSRSNGQMNGIAGLVDAKKSTQEEKEKAKSGEYDDFFSQYDLRYNALIGVCCIGMEPITETMLAGIKKRGYEQITNMKLDRFNCCLTAIASENKFNPVIDYVKSLPAWDGIDRIAMLASKFTVLNKNLLFPFERKLELFMAKAVKRWSSVCPGTCLTLVGEQQIGKSFFFKWLCPIENLFVSKGINPDSKDDSLLRNCKMVWEIAELASTTRRKDVDSLKSFLTGETTDERKAYHVNSENRPCKVVFCATVNNSGGFLVDTQNKRFLCEEIGKIDFSYVDIDKNQLWAQALDRLQAGKDKFTDKESDLYGKENERYRVETITETAILAKYEITHQPDDIIHAIDVLNYLIEKRLVSRGNEVASIFSALGVERRRSKRGNIYIGVREIKDTTSINVIKT